MNFNVGLYPVITEEFCNGRSSLEILKTVMDAGVKIVQLREKKLTKKELYKLAEEYRKITRQYHALLIINDHLDIAQAIEANGVHLGQEDLPCSAARHLAPGLIIGVSTHHPAEIKAAEKAGATYVNIGPIFATSTKALSIPPLGLNYLKQVKSALPFTVMGGIKKSNLTDVLACGALNIAMVTEITSAPDVYSQTKEIIKIIDDWKKK